VDLDGSAASFVNGEFYRSSPGGGEYAGMSASRVTAGDGGYMEHDMDAQ
jgi:hypothetical protein